MTNLFVYGTLRRGHGNNRLLKDSEFVGEATVNAKRLGPIQVIPTDGDEVTHGELYRVNSKTLRRVDHLEGYDPTVDRQAGYVRTPIIATLDDGNTVEAQIYYYMRRPMHTAR